MVVWPTPDRVMGRDATLFGPALSRVVRAVVTQITRGRLRYQRSDLSRENTSSRTAASTDGGDASSASTPSIAAATLEARSRISVWRARQAGVSSVRRVVS